MRVDQAAGSDAAREHFVRSFRELSPRVFAYAMRHCPADDAQDVVSDTFLTAWRRWAEVPENALPWLLVTARYLIANRARGALRQERLTDAVARLESTAAPAPGADHDVLERVTVLAALARLTAAEREAALLVAWDGLSGVEAAGVAGCSVRAFEVRLSRARARLTRDMAARPPDHEPVAVHAPAPPSLRSERTPDRHVR